MQKEEILEFIQNYRSFAIVDDRYTKVVLDSVSTRDFEEVYDKLDEDIARVFKFNQFIHNLNNSDSHYSEIADDFLAFNDSFHKIYHLLENVEDLNLLNNDEINEYNTLVDYYYSTKENALQSLIQLRKYVETE